MARAWAGRPQWRVLETDFGSGQHFLSAWRAWQADPQRPALLHFVSVCAFPSPPLPDAGPLATELAAQWNGLAAGFHRLVFEQGRVLLTLCVGELQPMLREMDFTADEVILAGTGIPLPALKSIARLCRRGASLATGEHDAQELAQCGIVAQEGSCAVFDPPWQPRGLRAAQSVMAGDCVVIGAGLAGAAVASSLARRGWKVRVLDAADTPAAGASAIPAGLAAPHHSPDDSLLSRLTRSGIRATLQQARALLREGVDWQLTGVQELRPEGPPLWHEQAGWIKPAALVRAWLSQPGITWTGSARAMCIERSADEWQVLDGTGQVLARAPLVIVAAAHGSAALLGGAVPLQPVRGQLSWALHTGALDLPAHPVKGNGHFLPHVPLDGGVAWLCGASYQRDDTDAAPRSQDHADNLERLRALLPDVASRLAPAFASGDVHAWTGVRCVSADRRPLAGQLAPGLWASTAMGSRGLSFAVLCAEVIAARLHAEPLPLGRRMAVALGIERQIGPQPAPDKREQLHF